MVVTPVHGIVGEVVEGVVHPAHVPLEAEAEPSLRRRAGDTGPRRRLLRDREHTGLGRVDGLVEQAEELDGVEVFTATLRVGLPLPRGARVVEVQHRRHRIDAQAVDVVLAQPHERARHEEVPDLVATEVEHERSPVGVQAATGIVVLVQRGAVEAGERPGVVREVRGDPVEQHPDAAVVQHVDHLPQSRPGCRSGAWARRTR